MATIKKWEVDTSMLLADGRKLGYRTCGSPDGLPLIFMHGSPGSRYVLSEDDPLTDLPGVYLVTPERPGYGLSTPQPGRTLGDWAKDIEALANHLGLSEYWVAGISGGAPHALACGHYSPDRVAGVFMMSSPAPTAIVTSNAGMSIGNRTGLWIGKHMPWLVKRAIGSYAAAFNKDAEAFMDRVAAQMCAPDQLLMQRQELREAMIADMREAYRQGSDAQFLDGQLTTSSPSWGFSPGSVAVAVFAWHGALDTLVPLTAAESLSVAMPAMHFTVVPDCGHLLTENQDVVARIGQIMSLPTMPSA